MDSARLTDNNGREADFRNVIIIMTSNAGAQDMAANQVGFGRGMDVSMGLKAIEKAFAPEFRNRLDGVVMFKPLHPDVMLRIVDKFVAELADQLEEKLVEIDVDDSAREWLAQHGYDEKLGARPLARVIQQNIKQPLANEILFGNLERGGVATVSANDDGITIDAVEAKESHEEE